MTFFVMMNGILFTYIISTASVTFPRHSNIPSVRTSHALSTTLGGVFLVLLPFSEPRFGPKMSSVHRMSVLLIQQFGSRFSSTYLMKS